MERCWEFAQITKGIVHKGLKGATEEEKHDPNTFNSLEKRSSEPNIIQNLCCVHLFQILSKLGINFGAKCPIFSTSFFVQKHNLQCSNIVYRVIGANRLMCVYENTFQGIQID